jgi:hypothetical protein
MEKDTNDFGHISVQLFVALADQFKLLSDGMTRVKLCIL